VQPQELLRKVESSRGHIQHLEAEIIKTLKELAHPTTVVRERILALTKGDAATVKSQLHGLGLTAEHFRKIADLASR
jgi:hypothetical protein